MALIESGRKEMRKRLRFSDWDGDTNSDEYVDVPVIAELDVIDVKSSSQESTYRFNNTKIGSRIADRDVRVQNVQAATVDSVGTVTYSASDSMDVERIKRFGVIDAKSKFQETRPGFRGDDPPPTTPENDTGERLRHRKVQYVRYTKDNTADGRPAVDMELIDETETRDLKEHAQESVLRLRHPDPDTLELIIDNSDPYAVNYELRLGFCDPELDMYEESVSNNIDPPIRLDPFRNIVNVLRDTYRFIGFLVDQNGSPTWTLQFVVSKAYVTEAEINAAEADNTLINVPVFGAHVDTPTDTISPNGVAGDPPVNITDGDSLLTIRPQLSSLTDYHGYIDLVTFVFHGSYESATEGPHVNFDYNGLPIVDIPMLPIKGKAIVSDGHGTVFVRLWPPDPIPSGVLRGFTKYDIDGNVLWTLDTGAETFKIIPADDTHPTYIKMFYTGTYIQDVYDLDGNYVDGSSKVFNLQDFSCQDVSRKGRYYGIRTSTTDGFYDDIICYDTDATTLLWEIPGEAYGEWRYVSITAYAEDYIVVGIDKPTNDINDPGGPIPPNPSNFTREHEYGYRVYNAHDGGLMYEVILPTDEETHTYSFDPPFFTETIDKVNYGGFAGMYRNRYWP